jgi:glucans biosynthesis protein
MVHDSDGLLIALQSGLWQWRPLDISSQLRDCSFLCDVLAGFGLLQRDRRFEDYLDLEARPYRRPSLWVEPEGDWGSGSVHLAEIPTSDETQDNVVAFWTPDEAPPIGQPWTWQYRLHWCDEPTEPARLSRVVSTRRGLAFQSEDTNFVIDFDRPTGAGPQEPMPDVELSVGAGADLREHHLEPNPYTGGWRVSLQVRMKPGATVTDLRCQLFRHGTPVSEQWNYLWSNP